MSTELEMAHPVVLDGTMLGENGEAARVGAIEIDLRPSAVLNINISQSLFI